ncbi:MAG: Pvc16 family protein [Candidatus Bathyarchaeota archaeon]|jgi:hypothetical protein|uniref:Pvc16 family protein n=1 Tax=Candidatus Bathycorpusculum sp. TaxID=2994959 RepID=UPI0028332AB2|nr:Pvc16 family protein [Candidatus Termiticorpusculum sp.]MCL2292641.1 Pvc16 family protein [Candidatus Termiticorpusculum sp.]
MSDYRAIATVTAVIRDILVESQANIEEGSTVDVNTSSPAALKRLTKEDVLSLFLYQITTNAAYRNADLPTRNSTGQLMTKPVLALDLHYLLSASSANELKAQLMLSSAMVALQENAIIPKNKISNTINADPKPIGEDFLNDSNLANTLESLKINLHPISTEELTKLWSSFFQTDYRLSVAYHVSVVFIESHLNPQPSLPVSRRQLQIIPLKQPIIEKIEPQIMTYDPQRRLDITGRHLNSDQVLVHLSGKEIKVEAKNISENKISILIPDDTLAGVKQVQILQKVLFNNNISKEHKAYTSNIAAFVLTPNLKTVTPTSLRPGETLTLTFEPAITKHQKVNVLIGDYVINADSPIATVTDYPLKKLIVKIPKHIPEGNYPVRLRVDNADSALKNDDSSQIITITNIS